MSREVVASILEQIQGAGEDLDSSMTELLTPPLPAPRGGAGWLGLKEASVAYGQVWYARTPSGAAWVVLRSHRRHGSRRAWYGRSLATGREVRVLQVLEGSQR